MRHRSLLLILMLVVSLFSITGLSAQEPTSDNPLQLLETFPLSGQELELRADIVLYFDRALDCATASAVTITPSIAGDIVCDGSTLRFVPAADYSRATVYTLSVDTTLQGADGSTLEEAFTLELNSVGYLQVSQILPADGAADVEANAAITVIFNRPVVALTTVEDAVNLPSPISISPAVEGQGEWLNTSIYVFRPDPAWSGGASYTVTVPAGLQAVDGSVLPEDVTWSFSVARPLVVEVVPMAMTTNVPLETTIQVRFNQPMNRESVEQAFALLPEGGDTVVGGTFEWADDDMGLRFTPNEALELGTVYNISIYDEVAEGAAGGTLAAPVLSAFSTVPLPAIISTDPSDGAEDVFFYGSFNIYFASAMNQETLDDKITIDPAPAREPDFYYYDYGNSLTISFNPEPSSNYTITIAPGMEDVYGNAITEERVIRFTTAPYAPAVQLQVPGAVGFYNANREQTQLFLTHLNVSRIDLSLYNLPLDQFVSATAGVNYYDPTSQLTPASNSLIRSWTIDSTTAENVYRYELLDLGGGGGGAASCDSSLPSRLKVGDVAIVVSAPDPVRARASVPDGEIVELLYRDYSLPVVGGPQCVDGIVWWEVRLRDESTAWVAEGVGEEYFLDVQIAANSTPVEVTTSEGGALNPGIYYLTAQAPELGTDFYQVQRHVLVVSTANLVMKNSTDSVSVWATDVETGAVIANAPITIYDSNMRVLAQGTTDAEGLMFANTEWTNDLYLGRVAVLQTDTQFGIGVNHWTNGIEPYLFGQNYNYYPTQYRVYVYTDRPVYRPGQPVYFRGVVRTQDDVTYTPSNYETVPVVIFNDQGEIVYQQDVEVSPYGTFSAQFDIDPNASLGFYQLRIDLPNLNNETTFYNVTEGAGISFSVAEYRLPEFQVNVTPEQDAVVQGDTIRVLVDSRYFFGGVVSNAQVEYNVISQPYAFDYQGAGYYSFMDFDYDAGPSEVFYNAGGSIASGTVTTDAQGQAMIEVAADLGDYPQSQMFTIEAVVTDESQQTVAGRAQVIVHQGLLYVGAVPEEYVGVAGEESTVNFIAVDWNSEGIANQTLNIEVVERRWSSVQEQDSLGRTTWVYEVEEIPVTTGTATTDADGRASFTFTPPTGGVFKIKVSTTDADGNLVNSATTLWVSSREYVSWRQQNSNRIDLIADNTDYEVGDTAEILITSPFQGTVEAWVTVERGDVLSSEHITMDSNSYVYSLPITADFAPNVYVSVFIVKGVDDTNSVAGFRMGLVALNVNNEQKQITIEITSDAEQTGPGDTITYTVTTTDYAGNPVQAEVGVALTDLAALTLADPNSTPILDYFYSPQGLGIVTSSGLTINTDQLTQETLDTIKGGGGGFGEGGIFDIRENFVDTAYWNPSLVTDENGVVTFEITLPDNLTTWRLDARAVTMGNDGLTLVGQNTLDIISTKPLLVRPVTPRFFVVGDEVTLAAVVNNNTGEAMNVMATLQSTGVTLIGDETQTLVVPAGGRQRFEWQVVVTDVENVELLYFVDGNDGAFTDASRPPLGQGDNRLLPVYRYSAPETVGTGGILREAGTRTEAIALPQSFDDSQGELIVNVEPSLAATTIDGLNYLQSYPYQCIEQTVSRFLPNIMTFRALNTLGQSDARLEQQLAVNVGYALQRLYSEQKVDGGWGWFVQDESNALTTAYALIGLIEARNQGFVVDENVIQSAQNYLRATFVVPDQTQPAWVLNRQAFVLYALARSGAPDIARASALYDVRDRLHLYAQAFLAQTFHMINPDDTSRTDTLVANLVSNAVLSANGAHWEEVDDDYWNWNTDTRTTAIVLDALIMLNPQSDLLPNAVRWLMIARTADSWETTQETAWAVMALTDWMLVTNELNANYDYSITLNGNGLAEGIVTPDNVRDSQQLLVSVSDLLADEANRVVIGRTDGEGALYYTAYLNVYLPVPEIEPLDRGIIIERRYTLLDGDDSAITEGQVGDVVQVRLSVIAPNDLHYVVIEDPIPAGSEGVDPNLSTNQQVGTQPGLDVQDPLAYGWGWWYFSNIEFRDERVVLYSTYLPAGTYEYIYTIRLGLAGTYNVIPATGYEFYLPEVYGRSAGSTFTIAP